MGLRVFEAQKSPGARYTKGGILGRLGVLDGFHLCERLPVLVVFLLHRLLQLLPLLQGTGSQLVVEKVQAGGVLSGPAAALDEGLEVRRPVHAYDEVANGQVNAFFEDASRNEEVHPSRSEVADRLYVFGQHQVEGVGTSSPRG